MKKAIFALLLSFAIAPGAQALAQGCSVCTTSELDAKSARGLNGGIVYLATLPLIAIGSIGFIWWRRTRSLES